VKRAHSHRRAPARTTHSSPKMCVRVRRQAEPVSRPTIVRRPGRRGDGPSDAYNSPAPARASPTGPKAGRPTIEAPTTRTIIDRLRSPARPEPPWHRHSCLCASQFHWRAGSAIAPRPSTWSCSPKHPLRRCVWHRHLVCGPVAIANPATNQSFCAHRHECLCHGQDVPMALTSTLYLGIRC
jgi:hypothetical protein